MTLKTEFIGWDKPVVDGVVDRITAGRDVLTGDNALFLILDDAFQYSDWERRPKLVDQVFAMAEKGWQIIYLTMDDNLRDLFCDKGKELGDNFVFKELAGA